MRAIFAILLVGFFGNQLFAQEKNSDVKGQGLTLKIVAKITHIDNSRLVISVKAQNLGLLPIYIAVNPTLPNGKRQYYISLPDDKTVQIESRIFAPSSDWIIERDRTSVELKELGPKEEYDSEISLLGSLTETLPPNFPVHPPSDVFKENNIANIREVQLSVGYFLFDQGIEELIKCKGNAVVSGILSPVSGPNREKPLYKLQMVASATVRINELTSVEKRAVPSILRFLTSRRFDHRISLIDGAVAQSRGQRRSL